MARKRRYPKKESEIKGTPYDSLLEKTLHETKLSNCKFHDKDSKVSYSIPHKYEPDFIYEREDGKVFLIETKGRFRDSAEARKYLFIREVLSDNEELIFIWGKPGTFLPSSKKRKDGTRATNEEWATKHGFRHWDSLRFKLELL